MLASLFARRYLLSRKSHSVINIISGVSAFAVSVPVAAMVILLSVFNGFEGLVKGMYNDFDPDVIVLPARGKTFAVTDELRGKLTGIDGVEAYSFVVEENAMVEYHGGQSIVTVRGVDSLYGRVIPVQRMMHGGEFQLTFGDVDQAVVGYGMAMSLGINPSVFEYMDVYAPRRGSFNPILPVDSYNRERLLPVGTFTLDAETESKYLIAPIGFARRLFDYPDQATGVAVKLSPGVDADKACARITAALGDDFKALTRYQQKASLYRIMHYEKWGIFLIIALVMVIASFSVIGSLVMLVIDKREDIATLVTMGATIAFVRRVFAREGMMICLAGAACGMLVGVGFCLLQQYFGLIPMTGESFIVQSYPVILRGSDLAAVTALFLAVSWVIVRLTVGRMIPKSTIRI